MLGAALLTCSAHLNAITPEIVCELPKDLVCESSGLTRSLLHKQTWWTHNDSGNAAEIIALHEDGRVLNQLQLSNSANIDWEDCCSALIDGTPYLIIADCGDNFGIFPVRSCLFITEPASWPEVKRIPATRTLTYRLEGGPFDCESIVYDPADRSLLLASKGHSFCRWYRLAIDSDQSPALATIIGGSDWVHRATAADLSPNGRLLAVYDHGQQAIFFYQKNEQWQSLSDTPYRRIDLKVQEQHIEALAFSADSRWLYLTSERRSMPLQRISITE